MDAIESSSEATPPRAEAASPWSQAVWLLFAAAGALWGWRFLTPLMIEWHQSSQNMIGVNDGYATLSAPAAGALVGLIFGAVFRFATRPHFFWFVTLVAVIAAGPITWHYWKASQYEWLISRGKIISKCCHPMVRGYCYSENSAPTSLRYLFPKEAQQGYPKIWIAAATTQADEDMIRSLFPEATIERTNRP